METYRVTHVRLPEPEGGESHGPGEEYESSGQPIREGGEHVCGKHAPRDDELLEADHHDLSMVADDVVFTLMGTDQEFRGPEAVKQMLHWFYHVAFDAKVAVTNTIFGDNQAVLEADVVGRHIGEYGGIPPTGKDFRVPLCVIYDLENDKIKRDASIS